MKTGTDTLRTAENVSGRAKHESGTGPVPPKMSPGKQNMKIGPDALGTYENESGCAKHENGT
jgi:hypothetical protein